MSEKLYQSISFWMMTFAIALWGVTSDRTTVEPSHIAMAILGASIWTFAFAWGALSAVTEPLSMLDKCAISTLEISLLVIAIVSALLEWPSSASFRDMPLLVLPMSVGIGIAYMFGATIRRHAPHEDRVTAKLEEA